MQSSCLELKEEQRRVKGTRMQRICLEQEERRVEETRMQRSCLEYEERRRAEGTECRAIA